MALYSYDQVDAVNLVAHPIQYGIFGGTQTETTKEEIMVRYFCDQTGEEIKGAIYRPTMYYPRNGMTPTEQEQKILQSINDLAFINIEAMATYLTNNVIE